MKTGIEALSEREKETLRLLLTGHDAKSIARRLGLSVHTVNERLRDARRKLQVSSSREAARKLGEAEHWTPDSFGDKRIGVAGEGTDGAPHAASHQRRGGLGLMLLGGTLIMSLIVAAVLLSSALSDSSGTASGGRAPSSAAAPLSESQSAAVKSAREWVAVVDAQKWEQSWQAAGTLFKSQVTAANWAAAVQPVRQPLGTVLKRELQSAAEHSSLPGAPAGEYVIVEFNTSFAKKEAVETVVLARENAGWKVVGYFIR
jgi:DNA-binding CsgD family transcriptional regulator